MICILCRNFDFPFIKLLFVHDKGYDNTQCLFMAALKRLKTTSPVKDRKKTADDFYMIKFVTT